MRNHHHCQTREIEPCGEEGREEGEDGRRGKEGRREEESCLKVAVGAFFEVE